MKEIRATLSIANFNRPANVHSWEQWVIAALREAGVPHSGRGLYDGLDRGTLLRLDDPTDFGVFTYVWRDEE